LQKLRVNVGKPHKSWERHLKYLLNYTTQCYIDTTPTDFNKRRELTQKFINLTQLLDEIHQRFGKVNLRQLITTTHDPKILWSNAHFFGITESTAATANAQLLQSSKQFMKSILQQLSPDMDNKFYTQYQQDLCYLEKLHSMTESHVIEKSADFSTPRPQAATTSLQIAPPVTTPFQAHNQVRAETSNRQPPFQTNVNFSRSIPKDLPSQLDAGCEIQWSHITQATLAEFIHIDGKLKLKSLMHQMTHHKIARQAAAAQRLQAIRESTHNLLQAFFTWLQQSYGLTKQETNTRLRQAVNDQKFDWRNNPAIDLQNAISQAHMTLQEIDSNEIFRETLKDALNFKFQPHYHLIADVKLSDLPDKLRHIWKTIAVPQPDTKPSAKETDPIILNANSTPQTKNTRPQAKKPGNETQKHTLNDETMEPLHHYLSQQLNSLTQQVQQIQQINTQPNDLRAPLHGLMTHVQVTSVKSLDTLHVTAEQAELSAIKISKTHKIHVLIAAKDSTGTPHSSIKKTTIFQLKTTQETTIGDSGDLTVDNHNHSKIIVNFPIFQTGRKNKATMHNNNRIIDHKNFKGTRQNCHKILHTMKPNTMNKNTPQQQNMLNRIFRQN